MDINMNNVAAYSGYDGSSSLYGSSPFVQNQGTSGTQGLSFGQYQRVERPSEYDPVRSPQQQVTDMFRPAVNEMTARQPDITTALISANQFASSLNTSARATESAAENLSGNATLAIMEQTTEGEVSENTLDNMYQSAEAFTQSYNSVITTFDEIPTDSTARLSSSNIANSVEASAQRAVSENSEELRTYGFNQNTDGTIRLDENRFREAVSEDPSGIADLFNANAVPGQNQTSNLRDSISDVASQAAQTSNITRQETAATVREMSRSTYQSMIQASTVASMSSMIGFLFNQSA